MGSLILLKLFSPLFAIAAIYLIGSWIEKRHLRRIKKRELSTKHQTIATFRNLPDGLRAASYTLAQASVVIGHDYFKSILAAFRNLIGGEVRSYGSLIERARREAILRMKESHPEAEFFLNCRLETSTIFKGEKQQVVRCVEVLVYATAIKLK